MPAVFDAYLWFEELRSLGRLAAIRLISVRSVVSERWFRIFLARFRLCRTLFELHAPAAEVLEFGHRGRH